MWRNNYAETSEIYVLLHPSKCKANSIDNSGPDGIRNSFSFARLHFWHSNFSLSLATQSSGLIQKVVNFLHLMGAFFTWNLIRNRNNILLHHLNCIQWNCTSNSNSIRTIWMYIFYSPECVFSSSGFDRRICCTLWSLRNGKERIMNCSLQKRVSIKIFRVFLVFCLSDSNMRRNKFSASNSLPAIITLLCFN